MKKGESLKRRIPVYYQSNVWCVFHHFVACFFIGIPRVTIRHDADSPTAGESYNLTCTVTINNTTEFPAIEWLGPNTTSLSNISSVVVENMVMVNESVYERTLVFSSLRTFHGGQYTCQIVFGQVWAMTSTELSVQSM